MKIIDIKLKYIFDYIFKGTTPIYSKEMNSHIIFGQRNNGLHGITYENCKYAAEVFAYRRAEKEYLRYGDILLNSLGGGTCGRVGFFDISDKQNILTDGIPYILRNAKPNKYYYYLLLANQKRLEDMALGATNQVSLKDLDVFNFQIKMIDDYQIQKNIVCYLDIKCSQIETICCDIIKQLNTLEQYKKSIILKCCTKGIKSSTELKNSGISYIGDIPNDWLIHPIYYYFDEGKTTNKLCKENNLLSLSYGKIIRKDINNNFGLLPLNFSSYNIVNKGDIIIRPTDLQNDKKSLRTGLVCERGIITSAYIDLVPKFGVNSKYYHYLLHSFDVMKVFYNMGNGVRQGLNYGEFSKLLLVQPSLEEQEQIVEYLDQKCNSIDEVINEKKSQVKNLEEYKKSLIYEFVTGKKEVA